MEKVRFYAACSPFRKWGQSGDVLGTKWGHYQYVKKFTHSHIFGPFFACLHPLPSLFFALPARIAGAGARFWCFVPVSNGPPMALTFSGGVGGAAVHTPARCPRCFAVCPGAVFDAPPTDANARPRKWPRKVPPFAPLSAALLTLWVWLACLWGCAVTGGQRQRLGAGCFVLLARIDATCAARLARARTLCRACLPAGAGARCPVPCVLAACL